VARVETARAGIDAAYHCNRPDADVGAADSSHWRAHRNPFPRVWFAGNSGLLSRLARAHLCFGGGVCGPPAARHAVAAISLWRAVRADVALTRARRMGDL